MTLHATLGASSSDRWLNCPGSVRLSEGIEQTTSPYARQGTAAHAVGERCLTKGVDADLWLDAEIEGELVTEEMAEAVQVYVDYVRDRAKGRELQVETRFDLGRLGPPAPMFGTADAVLLSERDPQVEVVDFKYGAGVAVAAVENSQLMYYALGAILARGRRARTIRVTIVQPRAPHADGIVRSWDFTWDDLVSFKDRLFAGARATQAEDAPLRVGDWCRFCPALATCPEQREHAVVLAQSEFDVVPEPSLPEPGALTAEQIGLVLEKAPIVEGWIRAIRTHVQGVLEAGGEFPGWALAPKRANRKWRDEEEAESWASEHGIDPYTKKVRSPAQMEKAAKEVKAKVPEELWEKKSSGYNLVQDDNPRAVLVSPANDFEEK